MSVRRGKFVCVGLWAVIATVKGWRRWFLDNIPKMLLRGGELQEVVGLARYNLRFR